MIITAQSKAFHFSLQSKLSLLRRGGGGDADTSRCVDVERKVMDWETRSIFLEDPSNSPTKKFEPVSGAGAPIVQLRCFDDILLHCRDQLIPAQVYLVGTMTFSVRYYSEYSAQPQNEKRYRIIGQQTPYDVEFSEFVHILHRVVPRDKVHHRLRDVNVLFSNFPDNEEPLVGDINRARRKVVF